MLLLFLLRLLAGDELPLRVYNLRSIGLLELLLLSFVVTRAKPSCSPGDAGALFVDPEDDILCTPAFAGRVPDIGLELSGIVILGRVPDIGLA